MAQAVVVCYALFDPLVAAAVLAGRGEADAEVHPALQVQPSLLSAPTYSCSKLLNSCGHPFSACVKLFSFSDQFCPKRWPSSSRSTKAPLKSARARAPNATYLRSSQGV
jgi:hypothetical protein